MSGPRIKVAVIGARGRLGSFACRLFESSRAFELVGAWERSDDWIRAAPSSGARVVFEATRAGQGFAHGQALLELGLRPVIATSGVSPDEVQALDSLARQRDLGGIVVPNFSLGAWLMQRAAELFAPHFAQAEIVEAHHTRKADAPSGTALDTARRIARSRAGAGAAAFSAVASDAARGEVRDGVALHSLRIEGVYARQEVLFSGPGEVLAVRHEMGGPEAFAPGIERAMHFAAECRGMHLGIGAALPS